MILLSRLSPYAEEITGYHQCEFRRSRSTIHHIFCIRQILEKKWEYNEAVHQLVMIQLGGILCNTMIEFGIPMKLVRLTKMCMTDTYSRVRVGKNLSDVFPIRNGLKQGVTLSPLFFDFASEYVIKGLQVNQDGLKLSGAHELNGICH